MSNLLVTCPKCSHVFEATDALLHQFRESVEKEFEEKLKVKDSEYQEEKQKDKRAMWEKAQIEAAKRQEAKNSEQMTELKEALKEQTEKNDEFRKQVLEMHRTKRKMEEAERDRELNMQRRLDEETKRIAEEVLKKSEEEYVLKVREKDKQIQDMQKALDEAKRKGAQGSQQTQGEVQELALEELLQTKFPFDEVKEVAKGVRGADAMQIVRDQRGRECGTIIWESKRTKAWTEGWITKLKEDQRSVHADFAVLVTEVLPKEISNFGSKSNVWVTNYPSIIGVVSLLRTTLMRVFEMRLLQKGRKDQFESLYRYITSTEFHQRMEAIMDSFKSMRDDLQKEKDAYQRIWAKREKQIEQVLSNTFTLRGELEGVVGELPELENLQLPDKSDKQDPLL